MITPRALKQFGFIVNFLELCHSIPFKWEHNKLVATRSLFHLTAWKLSIVLEAVYGIHNGLRFFAEIGTKPRDYLGLTVTIVWGIAMIWVVLIMTNGYTKMDDMIKSFNQIVLMDKRLQGKS